MSKNAALSKPLTAFDSLPPALDETLRADETGQTYSVQEASERAGISAHTLRYYERAGLLDPVHRVGSGSHRRYTDSDLRRVDFVIRMRATGMPIHQLRRYVALLAGGDATMDERCAMLEAHREKVCAQIAEQEHLLTLLDFKIANCWHVHKNVT